jgi:hypothetical protein
MPAVCGLVCYPLVSANGRRFLQGHFGPFVSAGKIPFPGNGDRCGRRLVRMLGLLRQKAEHLVLTRPFGGQIAKASHSQSMG